jgi:hypothetical protein
MHGAHLDRTTTTSTVGTARCGRHDRRRRPAGSRRPAGATSSTDARMTIGSTPGPDLAEVDVLTTADLTLSTGQPVQPLTFKSGRT